MPDPFWIVTTSLKPGAIVNVAALVNVVVALYEESLFRGYIQSTLSGSIGFWPAAVVSSLLFGGAHFFYMNMTVPLIPKWLPPSQVFWAYATGIGHIAAGLAILTGVQSRLAAILLTIMFASFTPLVHLPMLLADPSNRYIWSENALNLALTGAAWVVAVSFTRRASS